MPLRRDVISIDAVSVAPAGVRRVAGTVFTGDQAPRAIVCCLPGGGMSRRYFDLQAAGFGDSYSMAAHLVTAGFAVVTLDHPGVGESDIPEDGYVLTPPVVAAVNANAFEFVLGGLRAGTLTNDLPPLGSVPSIGCGHSMGAMLTVQQQGRHGTYDAVALLGHAGHGLRSHLTDAELRYADDPEGLLLNIARLTEARFGRPLSRGTTGPSAFLLGGQPVPGEALAAIVDAGANLLNCCGLTSMIPGASRPQFEAITVLMFVGVGDHDICGSPQQVAALAVNCPDLTLYVCPDSGHNHNVMPSRTLLWNRLARWIANLW